MKVIFNVLLNFTPPPSRNFHGKNCLAIFFPTVWKLRVKKMEAPKKKLNSNKNTVVWKLPPSSKKFPSLPAAVKWDERGGDKLPKEQN